MRNNEENERFKQNIEQIYREQNMDQAIIVLEKVKNARQRYENSEWLYGMLLPGPFLLVWQIKKLLKSNTVTSQLVKTLDPDELGLILSNVLYLIWVFSGIVILLSLKVSSLQEWIIRSSIFIGLLAIRIILNKRITRNIDRYIDNFSDAIKTQSQSLQK